VAAIVPVHLYGQMVDMDPVLELAQEHEITVVEDACQAHGAEYFSRSAERWCRAGSMGRVAAFSFYPGKNLGACGEAGAITTNDPELARQCRLLRDHGQSSKYIHERDGFNARLDALQAAFLRVKLPQLPAWNARRRAIACCYDQLLSGQPGLTLPHVPPWSRPSHHLYVVRAANRDALRADLSAAGIDTGIHYPIPLHRIAPYGFSAAQLPVTEACARDIVSLPMFPTLSLPQQRRVAQAVIDSVQRRTPAAVGTEIVRGIDSANGKKVTSEEGRRGA